MNDCIFCKIIKGEMPSKTIYEDDTVKAFLEINPASDGHILLIPKKHYVNFLWDNTLDPECWNMDERKGLEKPKVMR